MSSAKQLALLLSGLILLNCCETSAQVTLREQRGELLFQSTRAAGRYPLDTHVRYGNPVEGEFVVASGNGTSRRVDSLRIESWGQDTFVAGGDANGILASIREGFGVWLEPTAVRNEFTLKLDFARLDGGSLKRTQVMLRRDRNAYELTITKGVKFGQTRRGDTLVDLMLDYPESYRQFELIAHACSLPEVALVPQTPYSPSVIMQVIEDGESNPPSDIAPSGLLDRGDTTNVAPHSAASWPLLIGSLDSDQYATREQARRALLQGGPALGVYLENLDLGRFSLEQRLQIEYVVASLTQENHSDPQPLPQSSIAELRRQLNPRWLARLVASSDGLVRNWSIEKLRQQGIDISMPVDPTRYDRREAFRQVWSRLSRQSPQ